MASSKDYLQFVLEQLSELMLNNISCNDGRIYYLLSWKNRWRYI